MPEGPAWLTSYPQINDVSQGGRNSSLSDHTEVTCPTLDLRSGTKSSESMWMEKVLLEKMVLR